jgi:hypothetical protein
MHSPNDTRNKSFITRFIYEPLHRMFPPGEACKARKFTQINYGKRTDNP